MKKLVLKTVAITLAGIVVLCGILYGIFALFSPKTLGSISEQLGNKSATIYYYGAQYGKTGSTYDLAKYISVLGSDADAKTLQKLSSELVERDDFTEYCKNSGKILYGSEVNSAEYFYYCLANAEYKLGNVAKSIEASEEFISYYGYTEFNPERMIIANYLKDMTSEVKLAFNASLINITPNSSAEASRIALDLLELNK